MDNDSKTFLEDELAVHMKRIEVFGIYLIEKKLG